MPVKAYLVLTFRVGIEFMVRFCGPLPKPIDPSSDHPFSLVMQHTKQLYIYILEHVHLLIPLDIKRDTTTMNVSYR